MNGAWRLAIRGLRIAEVAREFETTHRALRYYEEEGLLSPARRGGARIYSQADRARLRLILRGRRVGLSVAEIRALLELNDEKGEWARRVEALKIFRARIAELETQRRDIEAAIAELGAAAAELSRRFPSAVRAAET